MMWVVMAVQKSIGVELPALNLKQEIPLSCSDGMVGMMPVFKTKLAAKRYAGKRFEIVRMRTR